jgi:hypothetical protein
VVARLVSPQGAAGQRLLGKIRIESRLSLYHHLEDDSREKSSKTLEKAIRRAYDVHNPFRVKQGGKDSHLRVALRGGTGSGGFFHDGAHGAPFCLEGQRGHRIIGTFVLPKRFFGVKVLPPEPIRQDHGQWLRGAHGAGMAFKVPAPHCPSNFTTIREIPSGVFFLIVHRSTKIYLVEEKKPSLAIVIADSNEILPCRRPTPRMRKIFSSILDREGFDARQRHA